MLTTRIIGVINIVDGLAVQTINFKKYLPIGDPKIAITFLNKWGIDEIIILNIKGSIDKSFKLYNNLPNYVLNCQVPVAAGGGIKNLYDIEKSIRNGADKVVINSSVYENRKIISEGSKEFGDQAIIVSIDVKKINKNYKIFTNSGSKEIELTVMDTLKMVQDYGAGEIMINSIDRNGSKIGYDLDLFQFIYDNTSLPIIGCGGVGKSSHFNQALSLGLSGLAAGNFFHYTEHSVNILKSYLFQNRKNIRLETHANYLGSKFNIDDRIMIHSDRKLEGMKYNFIPEEKI